MSGVRSVLEGQGNGIGRATGPAHVGPDGPWVPFLSGDRGRDDLIRAIEKAAVDLEALVARSDRESADILEFQVEMLTDPALVDIGRDPGGEIDIDHASTGQDAVLAWVTGLETYIAGFEQSNDADIRARALDVIDLRDRVLSVLSGAPPDDFPAGCVFVGDDLAPSAFLAHDWTRGGGIALRGGSIASHVALLARSRSVPLVAGLGAIMVDNGTPLLVDGVRGLVVVAPGGIDLSPIQTEPRPVLAAAPPNDAGALPELAVLVNIGMSDDLPGLDPASCDGIGLLRTEFLLSSPGDLADEEKQFRLYRQMIDWAAGRPVSIRLFDLGGDKPLGGFGAQARNPFLGLRGVRLLLARPDLLRVQARALLRAAVHGNLKVLVPMVTVPADIIQTRKIFLEEAENLSRRHSSVRMPELGMMVEVPAAALMLDTFLQADFFSLGTNDLAQYLMAAARDDASVSDLYRQARPTLLRLIRHTVAIAGEMGRPVAICGDLAGDPQAVPDLVGCGLRQFSVAPPQLAVIRAALARARTGH